MKEKYVRFFGHCQLGNRPHRDGCSSKSTRNPDPQVGPCPKWPFGRRCSGTAADVAQTTGRSHEAERLHRHLIDGNPNSLLRPYPTFATALQSLDIQDLLEDLRRQFPPEAAESMLLQVRADPLGMGSSTKREPSQKDTQEVIPPTARTIHMSPKQRKSPYENYQPPLPSSGSAESPWTSALTMLWLFLVAIGGLLLSLWTFARPLWDPA